MNAQLRRAAARQLYPLIGLLVLSAGVPLQAKPIAFQGGSTLMYEYGAGSQC